MSAADCSAETLFSEALRAFNAGDVAGARELCQRVLQLAPGDADALHLVGVTLCREGDAAQGIALIQLAIDRQPFAPAYWFNLATALQELVRLDEACDAYEQCLRLQPDSLDACNNYAEVVRRSERFEEALAFYDRMERFGRPLKALHLHRAVALACLGRDDEAEQCFRRSLAEEPGWLTAPYEFSNLLLRRRKFKEGWHFYERRFDAPHLMLMDCARLAVARWEGEPLKGKRILVHREQGLGDQIMFASVLPDLQRKGAEVWLDCAPQLRELFRRSFPWARQVSVVPGEEPGLPVETPDYEAPIGSLCHVLRQSASAFERRAYLGTDRAAGDAWRRRLRQAGLAGDGLRRVGVVWSSNPAQGLWGPSRRAQRKSVSLQLLEPLARSPARLISLHDGPPAERVAFDVADFSKNLTDLHQTAALASCMDLVISVDTAVAHLAAALGKPTWILLPLHADWRWGVDECTSYWYPHVRLFRQRHEGRWDDVIEEVARALAEPPEAGR